MARIDRRRLVARARLRIEPERVQAPDSGLGKCWTRGPLDDRQDLLTGRDIEARLDPFVRPVHEPKALDHVPGSGQVEAATEHIPRADREHG